MLLLEKVAALRNQIHVESQIFLGIIDPWEFNLRTFCESGPDSEQPMIV